MSEYNNFKEEFLERYSKDDFNIVDKLINNACEVSSRKEDFEDEIEEWICTLDIEKLDQLNFIYYLNIYKEVSNEDTVEIDLTFGFGVDSLNDLTEYSFEGISEKYRDKEIKILSDLKLNEEKVKDFYLNKEGIINENLPNHFIIESILRKARLMFDREKNNIMKLYNNQNYDNYVTGGGTTKTNSYYKNSFEKYHDMGLYWEEVYTNEIIDRNII